MNVRLLRKIAKVIQEKPKEFDMRFLHLDTDSGEPVRTLERSCGTAHCIAGWAQVLEGDEDIANSDEGQEVFGLKDKEQLRRLLFTSEWPTSFRSEYKALSPGIERSRVAAARINHFIKTKGAE